jgi:hypothetical protein
LLRVKKFRPQPTRNKFVDDRDASKYAAYNPKQHAEARHDERARPITSAAL